MILFFVNSDLSFKVKSILCGEDTVKVKIDSNNNTLYQVLDQFTPTVDEHNINTQITKVVIPENTISLKSTSNDTHTVTNINDTFSNLEYGGDTINKILATVTGVSFAENAVQVQLQDNTTSFPVDFQDITMTYAGSSELITLTPTQFTISENELSDLISIDTNNNYKLTDSFTMQYGSSGSTELTYTFKRQDSEEDQDGGLGVVITDSQGTEVLNLSQEDEYEITTSTFNVIMGETYTITLDADNFPEEISGQLLDENGNEVLSDGPPVDDGTRTFTVPFRNIITANINSISIPENSIQVSTVDDSS